MVAFLISCLKLYLIQFYFHKDCLEVKFMFTLVTVFQEFFCLRLFPHGAGFCLSLSLQLYVCISLHYLTPLCSALAHERGRADERNKGAGEGHFHIWCEYGRHLAVTWTNGYWWRVYFLSPLQRAEGDTAVILLFFFFKKVFCLKPPSWQPPAVKCWQKVCVLLSDTWGRISMCSPIWHLGKNQ